MQFWSILCTIILWNKVSYVALITHVLLFVITDLKIKTGSSICCSQIKPLAAILEGSNSTQINRLQTSDSTGASLYFWISDYCLKLNLTSLPPTKSPHYDLKLYVSHEAYCIQHIRDLWTVIVYLFYDFQKVQSYTVLIPK